MFKFRVYFVGVLYPIMLEYMAMDFNIADDMFRDELRNNYSDLKVERVQFL